MASSVRAVGLAAGCVAAFLSGASPGPVGPGPAFASAEPPGHGPRPSDHLPFEVVRGGLMTLQGDIGGLPSATLLVDTGSDRTIIDRRVAGRLRLPATPDHLTPIGGDRLVVGRVVLPSLDIGPLRARDLPVLVVDLESLRVRLGVDVDAIVGLDVLRGRCLTVDYTASTLAFECGGDWPSSLSLRPDSPHVMATFTVDGTAVRVLVDTGADAFVLFETALARHPPVDFDGFVTADRLDGPVTLRRFVARRVSFGNETLRDQPVFVLPDTAGLPGVDGVIGARRLASHLQFDLDRMVLSWRR